ncbi:MAG TPA: prephenate/arogenate dehydrogenase [Thermosynechococcaceae cyanobacterium]
MEIGIVGLGLIGGSLGLDLRSHGHHVLGVSRKPETCDRALERGVVDDASVSLTLMQQTDAVFICTPLAAMKATVMALLPELSENTVLTDVGSVKGWVMETIAPLWPNFVGGHPMAGTAESGIEAAQLGLFADAAYVLTPTAATPVAAIQTIEALVRPLRVRIYQCTPEAHDRAVAWISHLPVFSSASLIAACLSEPDLTVLELAMELASSGFRDTSRVGGGNPELGRMMAHYNKAALLRSLHSYREVIDQTIAQIDQEDWSTIESQLQRTQQGRSSFVQ